jgi:hypothetical protein
VMRATILYYMRAQVHERNHAFIVHGRHEPAYSIYQIHDRSEPDRCD